MAESLGAASEMNCVLGNGLVSEDTCRTCSQQEPSGYLQRGSYR